jgi:hypothetical protein
MTSLEKCPVCGTPVDSDQHACVRCGFKLVGQTEIFEAIGDEGKDIPLVSSDHHKPTLVITKGPLAGEVFALTRFPLTIGRDPACDIFLNNMTVSRKHAVLDVVDGAVIVNDTNSLNGIWVDGVSVDHGELVDGSTLQVGIFVMRFSLS